MFQLGKRALGQLFQQRRQTRRLVRNSDAFAIGAQAQAAAVREPNTQWLRLLSATAVGGYYSAMLQASAFGADLGPAWLSFPGGYTPTLGDVGTPFLGRQDADAPDGTAAFLAPNCVCNRGPSGSGDLLSCCTEGSCANCQGHFGSTAVVHGGAGWIGSPTDPFQLFGTFDGGDVLLKWKLPEAAAGLLNNFPVYLSDPWLAPDGGGWNQFSLDCTGGGFWELNFWSLAGSLNQYGNVWPGPGSSGASWTIATQDLCAGDSGTFNLVAGSSPPLPGTIDVAVGGGGESLEFGTLPGLLYLTLDHPCAGSFPMPRFDYGEGVALSPSSAGQGWATNPDTNPASPTYGQPLKAICNDGTCEYAFALMCVNFAALGQGTPNYYALCLYTRPIGAGSWNTTTPWPWFLGPNPEGATSMQCAPFMLVFDYRIARLYSGGGLINWLDCNGATILSRGIVTQ